MAKDKWSRLAIECAYDNYTGERVDLPELGIRLKKGEGLPLLEGYRCALNLVNRVSARFSVDDGSLLMKLNGLVLLIDNAEELFIANEIFAGDCYEFHADGKFVVIDVGMNVGTSSLYFALSDSVERVYGYEPFVPTFEKCQANLNLNVHCEEKIKAFNYGLSDKEAILEVDYDPENKGQVGVLGVELIRDLSSAISKEKIVLKPAVSEFEKIISLHPVCDVICKIDCEGAEFDIFRMFSEKEIPEAIKVVMMEWHGASPDELLKVLSDSGFCSFMSPGNRPDVGMIYAHRS